MNEMAMVLSLLAAAAVAVFLAWPWLARPGNQAPERCQQPPLPERRAAVLSALRDLDFDHAMGTVAREDYGSLRQALLAEAADTVAQWDEHAQTGITKQAPEAYGHACPACGRIFRPGDMFCARCGVKLVEARRECLQCGRTAELEDLYCRNCGSELVTVRVPIQLEQTLEA